MRRLHLTTALVLMATVGTGSVSATTILPCRNFCAPGAAGFVNWD